MIWRLLAGALLAAFAGPAAAEPISAILSVATMVGAAGGAAGFSLATAFSSVASGLAFAGGALSLVGNITGNKTLTKIGAVAGLAGLGTSLFNSAAQAGGAAASGAGATDAAGAGQLAETAGAAPLAADAAGAAGAADAAGGGLIDAASSSSAFSVGSPEVFPGNMPEGVGFSGGPTVQSPLPSAQPAPAGGLIDRMGEGLGKGVDWLNKSKGVAQIGAGLIQGAAAGYGQMAAQDAEMSYYDRLRRKFSASVAGMQTGGLVINPHANVTEVPPENVNRYTAAPQRTAPPPRPEIVRST